MTTNPTTGSSISVAEYKRLIAGGAGAGAPKKRASPEEDLQRACIQWVELRQRRYPILQWVVHVPNGGKRPKGEAGKLKAMGTKPGFPDILLPRKNLDWQGLVIELKSPIGRLSSEQEDWLQAFEEDGYLTGVARTLEQFEALVMAFLAGRKA